MIPGKGNTKTKEKNMEESGKAMTKEPVTSAEEEEGENKGEEGLVKEDGDCQNCCPGTRSRFPLTRIYP